MDRYNKTVERILEKLTEAQMHYSEDRPEWQAYEDALDAIVHLAYGVAS